MSTILIVDEDGKLSRRVLPRLRTFTPAVTSWRDFAVYVREHPVDIAILNLDTPSAPSLKEAVRLRELQPNLGLFYVMDMTNKVQDSLLKALCAPGVTWVSSKATDVELGIRLRSLVGSRQHLVTHTQSKTSTRLTRVFPPVIAVDKSDPSPWLHLIPELHSPLSGRLDAARTAEWFGMPLKTMAGLLDRGYATVHKTPDAAALQDKLNVFLRIASALSRLAGSRGAAKVWLNTPSPDLDDHQTPISAIEKGDQNVIAELLEDALVGQPG